MVVVHPVRPVAAATVVDLLEVADQAVAVDTAALVVAQVAAAVVATVAEVPGVEVHLPVAMEGAQGVEVAVAVMEVVEEVVNQKPSKRRP